MTRDSILEAAAKIFSEKGFHATSMQDIAEAVDLQKASLYHHFVNKQQILVKILDQALELINSRLEEVISQPLSADQKIRQAMVSYIETIADNQELAAVLLLDLRALDPELRAQQAPAREKFAGIWKQLISEGEQQGIFNQVDPSLTGRAILGVMNWTVTWYRKDGPRSAREIADVFADLLLNGLLVDHKP